MTEGTHHEGTQLEGGLGAEADELVEAPVVRDLARGVAGDVRPLVELLLVGDVALHLEAPALRGQRLEAEHAQGNAHLGRPAE